MEYTQEQLKKIREIELGLYHELARICDKHKLRFVTGFGTTLGAIRHNGFIPWDDDMDFLMPRKDFEKLIKVAPKELSGPYKLLEPRLTDGYVMSFAKLERDDSTFVEAVDKHFKYHCGIYIDIFPMDYWPQDVKKRDKVAFRCYVLLKLMVLATYKRPKFPKGLKGAKKIFSIVGCACISGFLKLFRITTRKLYKKYIRLASSTSREEAEGYVTDMCWCWIRKHHMFGLQYKDEGLFTQLYHDFEDDKVPVPKDYEGYLTTAYRDYMKLPPEGSRHCHMPEVLIFPDENGGIEKDTNRNG